MAYSSLFCLLIESMKLQHVLFLHYIISNLLGLHYHFALNSKK